MKRCAWLVAVLFVLVGCAGEAPAPEPSPSSEPVETFTARPAPDWTPEPEPGDAPEASPQGKDFSGYLIAPVAEVMAEMECEPVAESTRAAHERHIPIGPEAVQVFVGEGNEPGSRWWVVGSTYPDQRFPGWVDLFLTDQPGLDSGPGKWINLSIGMREAPNGDVRPTFHNVEWDGARLARAQSAVAKVRDCLGLGPLKSLS